MSHIFRPASRDGVQLIIGAAGASGSGKTYTLFELAVGLAYPEAHNAAELNDIIDREGKNRIAVIDTERGRAKHYAPPPGEKPDPWREKGAWFPFDHALLEPPFAPERYQEIIEAADDAGYRVIIVDSFSHEWAGEGGVLEMFDAEFERLGSRDATKMLAWVKPKMRHKKLIGRMTTLRAHLLVALRAEEKVKFVQERDAEGKPIGKEKIVAAKDVPTRERWSPVCEKNFPFELTLSFVLGPEAPGVPHYLKLQDQHKPFVERPDAPLTMETGRKLAAWAGGAKPGGTAAAKPKVTPEEFVRGYKDGLKECRDLDALIQYQAEAQRGINKLKEAYPSLHKEVVDANLERKTELERETA